MSYYTTTYSNPSGSCSASSYGPKGTNYDYSDAYGKVTASCSISGTTLSITLKMQSSNYPYIRVVVWVDGTEKYNSGYVSNNSSKWPRGNGTSHSLSYTIGASSNCTVKVGIGVSQSAVADTGSVALNRTATHYAYWDINAYNPAGVQDYKAAYFDEYIGSKKVATQVTNEHESHDVQPYGTSGFIGNIKPYYPYYELKEVWDGDNGVKGEKLSPKNGLYGSSLDGDKDSIYIYMKYKSSTLTFNLNGGSYNWSSPDRTMTYNSTTSTAPIPTRTGYKFLGWYTATLGGTKVFNANGSYNSGASDYWFSDGRYKKYTNLNIYAQWDIQNVCYIKQDNKWKLSTVYIKTDSGWQPAIMYIKTNSGWVQSGP